MNFFKKYRHLLFLLAILLLFGRRLLMSSPMGSPFDFKDFIGDLKIKSVTLVYENGNVKESVDLKEKNIKEFQEILGNMKIRKVRKPLFPETNNRHYKYVIKTEDNEYIIEFLGKNKFDFIDNSNNSITLKIEHGYEEEKAIKLFGDK